MITKQEFSKLRTIIKEEINVEVKKVVEDVLEEKLEQKLEEKLESKLEEKLESKLDQKLESKLDQKLKPIIKKLNKIEKDLQATNHFFDHEYLGHEKRIGRIETHLHFPQAF